MNTESFRLEKGTRVSNVILGEGFCSRVSTNLADFFFYNLGTGLESVPIRCLDSNIWTVSNEIFTKKEMGFLRLQAEIEKTVNPIEDVRSDLISIFYAKQFWSEGQHLISPEFSSLENVERLLKFTFINSDINIIQGVCPILDWIDGPSLKEVNNLISHFDPVIYSTDKCEINRQIWQWHFGELPMLLLARTYSIDMTANLPADLNVTGSFDLETGSLLTPNVVLTGYLQMELSEAAEKPQFEHDCDNCHFLGNYKDHDLYCCISEDEKTVIARFGDDGPDYTSGVWLAKRKDVLREAFERSLKAGFNPVD